MSDLERRIEKLEQKKGSDTEELVEWLDRQNLNVLERTRILCDAGIITGEIIAGWIRGGGNNNG